MKRIIRNKNSITKEEVRQLKIGDKIYKVTDVGIEELTIRKINNMRIYFNTPHKFYWDSYFIGQSSIYFKSKELAQKEFDYLQKIKIKKEKLYKYECELNKKLRLNEFLIKY